MSTTTDKRNEAVKELLNSTYISIKTVIPLEHEITKPQLLTNALDLRFGVLIGITGDIRGKLMVAGEKSTFASIGESMFGIPVEGEMLSSFSGELGNMLAGNLSTSIVEKGINIDITHPTIIQGDTQISGYKQALKVKVIYKTAGEMDVFLLLD